MLPLQPVPVIDTPFPHAVVDNFLAEADYAALLAAFPPCPKNSGPTGYSYFPGDAGYDALLAGDANWRQFVAETQSQRFVDHVLASFPDVFASETSVKLNDARFVSYIESRDDKEKEGRLQTGLARDALFVRTDLLQGNAGYDRVPHLDHRRRAATMLLYFCDADEIEMEGGDLVLHHVDQTVATTIRPRHNRMVMFPCNNQSWHSVSRVTAQKAPRSAVQITVSGSVPLWPSLKSPWERITGELRRMVGRG